MTEDLFGNHEPLQQGSREIGPGALLLRGRALTEEAALITAIRDIAARAPFRRMVTPGGFSMSVAMTSCGASGWVSDRRGYRYAALDPESGLPWPAMPPVLRALAEGAAAEAGYPGFHPDTCLINRYEPGAKMALHQDKDERDFTQPIVSVSLGLPATFQFGGAGRKDPVTRHILRHGDVVVWGGPSRLWYHGILTLKPGEHPAFGAARINLTFRRAGA